MFQGLGDKLQGVFENLRGRGKLSEGDVKAALREVRIALLEADVNLMVAKDFVSRVQEKAIGSEVLMSLRPDERVVSIVHDELVETLGGKAQQPQLKEQNLWMLVGLQGSGKTTTAGKLAYKYKSQGRRPLLVAADTQRPAAREQLAIIAKQVGVPILEVQDNELPQTTVERINTYLKADYRDLIIVDTAGRLQIDETLMEELDVLHDLLAPDETMLVIDSMTGQQSLDVAGTFDARIGVSGLVMTKLDGDARGGAALSAKQVTGKPIYFGGISEKLDGLEPFYPERVAGRILGMGDVMTLIEKAKAIEATEDEPARIDEFSLQDMLTQMQKIKQMGSFSDILKMIPGANKMLPPGADVDDKQIARIEAIISSMTEQERRRPRLLNASRRKRIAAGSGTSVQDVNRLMKNYEQMKKMMKKMMRGGKKRGGFPGMPPM
jgi:signal recognition particle subunit SRP54